MLNNDGRKKIDPINSLNIMLLVSKVYLFYLLSMLSGNVQSSNVSLVFVRKPHRQVPLLVMYIGYRSSVRDS